MKCFRSFFVCLTLCTVTQADIIPTIGSGTFAPNSGIQSIDVFARSNAGDSLVGLTAFFELKAGVFQDPPGAFGQPGMIGSGNINAEHQWWIHNRQWCRGSGTWPCSGTVDCRIERRRRTSNIVSAAAIGDRPQLTCSATEWTNRLATIEMQHVPCLIQPAVQSSCFRE